MKRIILFLIIILFTPIYSQAISYHELIDNPQRFWAKEYSTTGATFIDFYIEHHIYNDNSTLITIANTYYIYPSRPNRIYAIKQQQIWKGPPGWITENLIKNIPPQYLVENGTLVSRSILDIQVFSFDGTFLSEETENARTNVHNYMAYYKSI